MQLQKDTIKTLCDHALKEYPFECCGIITGNKNNQTVHLCENIQNRLHAEDPAGYPRDARIAYTIERNEFDRVISGAKKKGEHIIAFYHSHPEHEAYFSEEDHAAQTVFGEPEFPDALQVVLSVISRRITDIKCYLWDRDVRMFRVLEECS